MVLGTHVQGLGLGWLARGRRREQAGSLYQLHLGDSGGPPSSLRVGSKGRGAAGVGEAGGAGGGHDQHWLSS